MELRRGGEIEKTTCIFRKILKYLKEKKMRKSIAILVLIMVFSVSIFAFAEKTVVEFWTTDSEKARVDVQEAIAADFMKLHPDIEVKVIPVNEEDIPKKIATAKAAGKLPDVARIIPLSLVPGFALEGLLDTKAATATITDLGYTTFYKGALDLVRSPTGVEGIWAAVPGDGWPQGIWYRKDLFAEKGLAAPTSWDTILEAAKAFYDPASAMYGIIIGTDPGTPYTQEVFEHFALSNSATGFDKDGNIVMNTPEMVETLDYYTKLAAYGPPGACAAREARQYYIVGQVAMMFYSPYIMDDLAGLVDEYKVTVSDLAKNTGFVPIIEGPKGIKASFGDLEPLVIFKGTDTEAAIEWVKYLLGPGYLTTLFMSPAGKVPVRKTVVDEWLKNKVFSFYDPEVVADVAGGMDMIKRWGFMEGNVTPLISAVVGRYLVPIVIGKILTGDMTPAQAAAWLQEQTEALK